MLLAVNCAEATARETATTFPGTRRRRGIPPLGVIASPYATGQRLVVLGEETAVSARSGTAAAPCARSPYTKASAVPVGTKVAGGRHRHVQFTELGHVNYPPARPRDGAGTPPTRSVAERTRQPAAAANFDPEAAALAEPDTYRQLQRGRRNEAARSSQRIQAYTQRRRARAATSAAPKLCTPSLPLHNRTPAAGRRRIRSNSP
jgi:hypothetical protein